MSDAFHSDRPRAAIEQEAAAWVLRCDRGLTPAEQDAFSEWLAADPRHRAQLARHRRHWERMDRLAEWRPEHSVPPNSDLLAPPATSRWRWAPAGAVLAAAAAIALLLAGTSLLKRERTVAVSSESAAPAASRTRTLEDGTIVELNPDAVLTVQFTPVERRVRLERGEALFAVAKNAAWPFIVSAAGVDVRAVGTAFNVRVDADALEVLVTEGRVEVGPTAEARPVTEAGAPQARVDETEPRRPALGARQRALVSLRKISEPPQIATLTTREIERVLAWQHRQLEFSMTPLGEVVAEFNRRNVTQLVIVEPGIAAVRISGRFRSENLEGFVRLLEAGFGVKTEQRGETEILIRAAR